ncbi:MAG: hypothetical protein ACD_63C00252G0001 [uncultured bacterium]|nr:MAG: hypothetical protein ACD_63C00252G0001 [uncultured bacterium]
MDFVEGEDLATSLYKEVVRRHPSLSSVKGCVDRMPLNELAGYVSGALGFEKPGGKHVDPKNKEFERAIVFKQNAVRLITFLSRNGYVISERILRKIEKTMQILNKKGIKHGDLHERNVMVRETGDGDYDVYIVDFGDAEENCEMSDSFSDQTIVKKYMQLTKSFKEKRKHELDKLLNELKRIEEKLKGNKKWEGIISTIPKSKDTDELEKWMSKLTAIMQRSCGDDLDTKYKMIALLQLAKENFQMADNYITEKLEDTKLTSFVKNSFIKVKDIIASI